MADGRCGSVRVLQVIETTGPGGAETVFLELLRGLGAQGVETFAVLAGPGWVQDRVKEQGVPYVVCPSTGSFDVSYLNAVRRYAAGIRADLIHGHMLGASAYAALAAAMSRTPMVATLHGMPDLGQRGIRRTLKALALRAGATKVVCVSDALNRAAGDALGVPQERVTTIHNGVDTDLFAPGQAQLIRDSLGIGRHEYLALSVGNFRPSKGYLVLLEAIGLVRARGLPVRFVVVGQGDNVIAEEFRVRREEMGLGGVVSLLGFREDIPDLMRAADLYVLSSLDEGFSLTTVQAMATGLPVLATRCGGPEEIIRSDEEGLLVEPGSATALAEALTLLAADPNRRKKMATSARRAAVERFAVSRMVAQYAALYRELVDPPA